MGVGEPLPAADRRQHRAEARHGLGAAARIRPHRRTAWGLVRAALATCGAPSRAFYAAAQRALRSSSTAIDAMPLTALAAEYRRIEAELLERWDAPLVNDFLCMMAFGSSRKLLERWAGQAGLELHNDVMIGQGDIVSAEPAQRIARMGVLAADDPEVVAALAAGDARSAGAASGAGARGRRLPRQIRRPLHRGAEARKHHACRGSAAAADGDRGRGANGSRRLRGLPVAARCHRRVIRRPAVQARYRARRAGGWPRRGCATARICASSAPGCSARRGASSWPSGDSSTPMA